MNQFRINYILPNIAHHKDTLINDYFDTGMEQKQWFKDKALERKNSGEPYPNDKSYIKEINQTIRLLKETKETAIVEVIGNDLKLSFDILTNSNLFEQVNSEGMRPWLRNHLDDYFISTMRTAILQKSFDWKNPGEKAETINRFEELSNALDKSLENAYELRTPTFWIDGETPEPIEAKVSVKNKIK